MLGKLSKIQFNMKHDNKSQLHHFDHYSVFTSQLQLFIGFVIQWVHLDFRGAETV